MDEKEEMKRLEDEEESSRERSTTKQVILCLVAYFTAIAPSMSLGYSAVALPGLTGDDKLFRLDEQQSSWFVSVATIATPIGCFFSGPISDRYGRKTALLVINAVCFVGWTVLALAPALVEPSHVRAALLVGRLITGLSTGLASMPSTVYMAEVSSAKLRGTFTTASALFFSLGILTVYLLGAVIKDDWSRIALVASAVPIVATALTAFLLPESPQWLVSKGREPEAETNLAWIFGCGKANGSVAAEMRRLVDSRDRSRLKSKSNALAAGLIKKIKYLRRPSFYKPFAVILSYFFFMQFSGCFVIVFYAIDIVKEAGVTVDPYVAIVMIAATRAAGAVFVCFVTRKLGRRPPSVVSGIGMTACMLSLFVYLYLVRTGTIAADGSLTWVPVAALVGFFFTSTLGFVTVPFAMAAEVFPTKVRGLATGLVTCLAYAFNFVILKLYPAMLRDMGSHGVFLFYGAVSFVGTLFIVFFLPETKGKTLQEIEEYFGKKKANIVKEKLLPA